MDSSLFLTFVIPSAALVIACILNVALGIYKNHKNHKRFKKDETERVRNKLHEINAKYHQLKNNNPNTSYTYSTHVRYEIQRFQIKYFVNNDVRKDLLRFYYIARIGNISLGYLYFLSKKSERANYFKQKCHYGARLLNISKWLTKESNPAFLYCDYTYLPGFSDRCYILYKTLRLLSIRDAAELALNGYDPNFIINKIDIHNTKFVDEVGKVIISGPMLLYKCERAEWIMLYFSLALDCPWPVLDSLVFAI